MPLILPGEELDSWLLSPPDQARSLLAHPPDIGLEAVPISRAINNPQNEGPKLVSPITD